MRVSYYIKGLIQTMWCVMWRFWGWGWDSRGDISDSVLKSNTDWVSFSLLLFLKADFEFWNEWNIKYGGFLSRSSTPLPADVISSPSLSVCPLASVHFFFYFLGLFLSTWVHTTTQHLHFFFFICVLELNVSNSLQIWFLSETQRSCSGYKCDAVI